MFNSAMETCALQQHINFTNALQIAGVKGFFDENSQTNFVERGPITYAARTTSATNYRAIRGINPQTFCVLNPDSSHDIALRQAGFYQVMTPASVAEIDLSQIWQPLQKWRNALRKAQKSGGKIYSRPLDFVRDRWLFDVDRAQQRQKKFRAMPHAIAQFWPAKDTLLCTLNVKNAPAAAMLFLIHGQAATYQIGWTNDIGRAHAAHNNILAQAVEILQQRGILRLDLGIVDTVNAPDLARFKIGSGAKVRPLGGTWMALPQWRR